MKINKYRPFKNINNFYIESDADDEPKFLHCKDGGKTLFSLEIKHGGYVPKSGLLLCKSLSDHPAGKSVLEIGTGQTSVISIYCSRHGAKNITATDIDTETVEWAKRNCHINKIKNIDLFVSDIYKKISNKYDLIISNPPQLPSHNGGSPHDFGGSDGREILEKIIVDASKHLNKHGVIFLLVFDFLSVNRKYGKKDSLFDLLKRHGFKPSITSYSTHIIRRSGKTFESIGKIRRLYPKFRFIKNLNGDLTHKIYIVKAEKIN